MNFMNNVTSRNDGDVLAMAFVNMQPLTSIYDTERGFSCGTIFPALYKPLEVGGRGK